MEGNQVVRLLDKLVVRTSSGYLKWAPSIEENTFAARHEGYVIELSSQKTSNALGGGLAYRLVVNKLDGTKILQSESAQFQGSSWSNALAALVGVQPFKAPLEGEALVKVSQLEKLIAGGSADLESLINSL